MSHHPTPKGGYSYDLHRSPMISSWALMNIYIPITAQRSLWCLCIFLSLFMTAVVISSWPPSWPHNRWIIWGITKHFPEWMDHCCADDILWTPLLGCWAQPWLVMNSTGLDLLWTIISHCSWCLSLRKYTMTTSLAIIGTLYSPHYCWPLSPITEYN